MAGKEHLNVSLISDRGKERVQEHRTGRESAGYLVDVLGELLPTEALNRLSAEENTGPGGVLNRLTGRMIETALGVELTEHLTHAPRRHAQGPNAQRLDAEDGADRQRAGVAARTA